MLDIIKSSLNHITHSKLQKTCVCNNSIYGYTVFRNDDVSFDSNVEHLREFCDIFHAFGYIQMHGITLYGRTNCSYIRNGIPALYDSIDPMDIYDYEICKSVSTDYIGDNKELIMYLNSIPDELALHGLYHSDYSKMNYEEQYHDIEEALRILHELFPHKVITTFIAPFNHTNVDTYKVCEKFGLRVSQEEGEHLEDMIANNRGPIQKGQLYRYHHHRFYPESTFSYYDLSIEKLYKYFKEHAYTFSSNNRVIPSMHLVSSCIDKYKAQSWYKYSFQEFSNRKHAYSAYEWITKNLSKEKSILEVACGAGGMLYHLQREGYTNLKGYDFDVSAINAAKDINKTINGDIEFYIDDAKNPNGNKKYDVIVWVNGMYHLEDFSLNQFFDKHVRMLNDKGYIVFDMVDSAFNVVPQNEYCTQDWERDGKKRPSEYRIRMSKKEVIDTAKKYNARLAKSIDVDDTIPRKVYIFERIRPKICLYCDRPNWAHDNSAQELKKQLDNEFNVDIKYVIDNERRIHSKIYDAFLVFFWGEESYKKYKIPKNRIIKQVSSQRWEFDEPYGPISSVEFTKKYLNDASTVICPSKILYNKLKVNFENLYLCGKGYSPEKFYYKNEREGELSLCMVGNIEDPVKGVEDILKPSAQGYKLDIVNNMKHEQLNDFYNSHDIYVVSSMHEADPLPLIESMACGCFPIASRIGIAPELIHHKVNGYLVDERTIEAFREAYRWCDENKQFIRKQARNIADQTYEKRRWDVMSEEYRKVLRSHIERK